MFDNLRCDAERYAPYGGWWRSLGFWAGATYRSGAWAHQLGVPGLRHLLLVLTWALKLPFRLLLHLELPNRARIGPGLLLLHPYNVLIGNGVEIGEECSVYHEVTLGLGPVPGLPRLGNHVVLFAGAKVFGGITIGERTEIGANCVVTRDVPAWSLVVTAATRTLPQSLVRKAPPPAGQGAK